MTAALLEGVRILDLGIWRPVPYATQLLAEMGADVVKVEPPGGDPMRVLPELFDVLNAGKRSVVIDLKEDAGRDHVLALAADADAFLEGFRPGVADRLGVGYEAVRAVNAAIVYCSVSGYGATGPLAHLPGHDVNYQAYAGVIAPRGRNRGPVSLPVGDLGAGMTAAMATVAACLCARRTGEGERIDVGIADVLATWTGAVGELTPSGSPRAMDGLPGYGTYRTSDGHLVAIGVLAEDHFWSRLCRCLGLEEHADAPLVERVGRTAELDAEVASAVSRMGLPEVLETLERHDVPVAPVLSREEMLGLDHFRVRGTVHAVHAGSPQDGRGLAMGHPARYEVHPAREPGPAPALDGDPEPTWSAR